MTEKGEMMGDRELELVEAARPSAYYIFPVIVGEDGEEDFATPIRQATVDDAMVKATSLQAKHKGMLVVAWFGPALELGGDEGNYFIHIATIGAVPDTLRNALPA